MLRKIFVFSLLLAALSISQTSRAQEYIWAKNIGGTGLDASLAMTLDDKANVYTIGYFWGTGDLNAGPDSANFVSNGLGDVFITKYDKHGNYLWGIGFGSGSFDIGWGITIDDTSNVYVTGTFGGTIDLDPSAAVANLTSNGLDEIFLAKYDKDGNYKWGISLGGTGNDSGNSIALDSLNNIFVTGSYSGTVDFDPGSLVHNLTSNGNSDIFIAKYDNSGKFLWANGVGSSEFDAAYSVDVDRFGSAYITGNYRDTVDFNPGSGVANRVSNGIMDAFIAKYSSTGIYLWSTSIGSVDEDFGKAVRVDTLNNVFVTGEFFGTSDFDPSSNVANLTSAGPSSVFIAKYDKSGNYLNAIKIDPSAPNIRGHALAIDKIGNIYASGEFQGVADFDPSNNVATQTSSIGQNQNTYIAKYDNDLNYITAISLNGSINNARGIGVDQSSNIFAVGFTYDNTDFDPGLDSVRLPIYGASDGYIAKYTQCSEIIVSDSVSICGGEVYTFPDGTTSSLSITDTSVLSTLNGCDSIIITTLNVDVIDTSIVGNDNELVASLIDGTYQWVDCDKGHSVLIGDTNRTYVASASGNYAVIIEKGGCVDTSACQTLVNVGEGDIVNSNWFYAYPNPVQDKLTVTWKSQSSASKIVLRDALGKEVVTFDVRNRDKQVIDVSEIVQGVYFVELHYRNSVVPLKLLKK